MSDKIQFQPSLADKRRRLSELRQRAERLRPKRHSPPGALPYLLTIEGIHRHASNLSYHKMKASKRSARPGGTLKARKAAAAAAPAEPSRRPGGTLERRVTRSQSRK